MKASYAERAIKTIQSRLVRYLTLKQTKQWVNILPKFTESFNKTYHRSIKRTLQRVKAKNLVDLWKLQYTRQSESSVRMPSANSSHARVFKYKVEDLVCVSFLRHPFQRAYHERWSREFFVVNQRFTSDSIPQYRLKDYAGELVSGTFL